MKTRVRFSPPSGRGGETAILILWSAFWFGCLWAGLG